MFLWLPPVAAVAQTRQPGQTETARRGPIPGDGGDPPGPADTMMLAGRQDFSRYPRPGACLRAAMAVDEAAHFADEDTAAAYDHTRDTLATAAIATARRCGTHFTLAKTPLADLLDVMHLALYMGDDTLARAAGDQYVASVTEPEAHRWALYALDTMYVMGAKPIRIAAAEAVAARLDALGPAAAVQRVKAHTYLMIQARLRYDIAAIEREAVAELAAELYLTADDRTMWDGAGGGNAASEIFFIELYRNPKEALARTEQRLKALGYTGWNAAAPMPPGLDRGLAQVGTPAPPLQADFWVGADSTVRTWPVPGQVSVYLSSKLNDAVYADESQLQAAATRESNHMAKWRRMLARYGPALHVTVLAKTHGSFQGGPPLSPAEEAARLGKFYREELGLPVTVAVQTTPVKQLADGRRILGKAPYERDPYYSEQFILANRDGRVALALPNFELEEAMLDAWLARAVGTVGGSR